MLEMCTLALGIALHSPDYSLPEVNLDEVIGVVRVECELTKRVNVEAAHISGISTQEEGYGLNYIGINVEVW